MSSSTDHPITLGDDVLACLEKHKDWFTTGDLARECGLTLRAIRHYESLGLIRATGRSRGRHRVFAPAELLKVRLIGDLRAMGLGLDEIGAIFAARERCATGAEAAQRVLSFVDAQVAALDRTIERLQRTKHELAATAMHLDGCTACRLPIRDDHCGDCEGSARESPPRLARMLVGTDGPFAAARRRRDRAARAGDAGPTPAALRRAAGG